MGPLIVVKPVVESRQLISLAQILNGGVQKVNKAVGKQQCYRMKARDHAPSKGERHQYQLIGTMNCVRILLKLNYLLS